jgi:YVTN family beta-propeller protein
MLLVLLFALLALCAVPAFAAPYAYIPAFGGNSVAIYDLATGSVIARPTVGTAPAGVAISPDGTRIFVVNQADGTVTVMSATGTVLDTIAVGTLPEAAAYDRAAGRVYVTNGGDGTVSVIDAATDSVVATVTVGSHPRGIAVNPASASARIYVANFDDGTVSVIDAALGVVGTIALGAGSQPVGMALDPSGARLFVAALGTNAVERIDTTTQTVSGAFVPTSARAPVDVVVDHAGTNAYATFRMADSSISSPGAVAGFTVATLAPTMSATVADAPWGIDIDAQDDMLVVPSAGSDVVNAVATASPYTVSTLPFSVASPAPLGRFIGPGVPTAPLGVAASAGDAQASVSFSSPASDGGSPIVSYTATCGTQSATGSGSPLVVTGLANGTPVTCSVVAANALGTGAAATTSAVTPATLPGAPTAVAAAPGDSRLVVSFSPPASDGGSPILSYVAKCGTQSASGAGSPIIVSGLRNGTSYACTVAASNGVGSGPVSAPVTASPVSRSFTGPVATGLGSATVTLSGGGASCTFAPQGTAPMESAFFIPVTGSPRSPATAPPVAMPFGLLDFTLLACAPGSTVTIAVTYPSPIPAGAAYYKFGPTPSDASPHWYVLPGTLAGNTATFTITDGALGDDDLAANGSIVDQGGPGGGGSGGGGSGGTVRAIPTLGDAALIVLALLFGASGAARMRRR